jgi:hypothetical protein
MGIADDEIGWYTSMRENAEQVLGKGPTWWWLLPVAPADRGTDGCTWFVRGMPSEQGGEMKSLCALLIF